MINIRQQLENVYLHWPESLAEMRLKCGKLYPVDIMVKGQCRWKMYLTIKGKKIKND